MKLAGRGEARPATAGIGVDWLGAAGGERSGSDWRGKALNAMAGMGEPRLARLEGMDEARSATASHDRDG